MIYRLPWFNEKNNKSINKKGNKCFQHVITIALNHEEIGKHPERITKIRSFINKYNKGRINPR